MVLVQAHLHAAPALAAGVASLPSAAVPFAATQAAWRFLNNPRVTLPALVEPLREAGRSAAGSVQSNFLLLVHDWSKLGFGGLHKQDFVQLTHEHDTGYDLTAALLVNPDDGSPLAPMELHLRTSEGVLSTRQRPPQQIPHLDQVLPTMRAARDWNLPRPLVHVIDREADSVGHYRSWDAAGYLFLVRADDRRVRHAGVSLKLSQIVCELERQEAFEHVGEVAYQGHAAQLWIAETDVTLYRPAKKNRQGKKYEQPGRSLSLRFIAAQVRDLQGRKQAEWMLLSNVPQNVATTEHLARSYYWRWRIESFFKLLKSHGQQVEAWQQESGAAIARRLLVAAMACVLVWSLQSDASPAAAEFRQILVRLSGRQMKRQRPSTAPALLAGLWVLLSMLALLEQYDLRELKRLAKTLLPFDTG